MNSTLAQPDRCSHGAWHRHKLLGVAILATGPAWTAPPPAKVIVAVVQERAFADPIEALGTLKARESIDVTATVSETVTAIHFDAGERVEAGQVLIEMTDREVPAPPKVVVTI